MDKKELETKREELEKLIRDSEKYLNKVNERLKELENFRPSISINALYYGNNKTTFTVAGSLYSDRFCGMPHELSILTIARAVFTMIDLANWCNAQENPTDKSYELCYDNVYRVIAWGHTIISNRSMVKFTSMNSVELALEQINSKPELKRLALIFLGVSNENSDL